MANQKSATANRARFKRDGRKRADRGTSQHGNGGEAATYEQELAQYLQERIKPGLNRGSIVLQARSIAKEIAHRRPDEDADVAGEPSTEEDDEVRAARRTATSATGRTTTSAAMPTTSSTTMKKTTTSKPKQPTSSATKRTATMAPSRTRCATSKRISAMTGFCASPFRASTLG